MNKFLHPSAPAPLYGIRHSQRVRVADTAPLSAFRRMLPGLLLKLGAGLLALEIAPVYGLLLGDLFGPLSEGLSFALTRI